MGKARHAAIVARIWNHDYLLWGKEPDEISNRLGWLKAPTNLLHEMTTLLDQVNPVLEFPATDCVLLGMGGSSLCVEVLSSVIGSAPGRPRVHVLDSTCPAWVDRVAEAINLDKTLFIVASKSGGTIEVMSAFKHFWDSLEGTTPNPGDHFIAITDPGTGLSEMATARKFRAIFENDPNIGGRFSVLSYFGMIPAFLMGADVETILRSGFEMAHATKEEKVTENPGVSLGVFLSVCALEGRDKLTLLSSPRLERLGLWVEQLIAESTGKDGKGILPVATEPILPETYGSDRCFVATIEEGDTSLNPTLESLKQAGHPVLEIEFERDTQLGMEFYRWEFATAVVGHLLGIQPFDQPNVQLAKTRTGEVIDAFRSKGSLPQAEPSHGFPGILEEAKAGSYFSIHCYTDETPEIEGALQELRIAVMKKHGIATTSGYGPRFLHSTGQYHKGGPNTGLFLQIVQGDMSDLPVPGEDYNFATLCQAQSIGDLQALKEQGRKVARLEISGDLARAIHQLASQV
ncbi:MAG: glucose-6-phosphate isomerase [Candidatus Omnitrophica bacterium]|nr:glucose-6-phosphate isomerase [Candidatus Omnitrophota bacterium]